MYLELGELEIQPIAPQDFLQTPMGENGSWGGLAYWRCGKINCKKQNGEERFEQEGVEKQTSRVIECHMRKRKEIGGEGGRYEEGRQHLEREWEMMRQEVEAIKVKRSRRT
ncbi:unnamed protein product [Allacma fusca]|uniref:Uncharacterized protein n=1 Tax=Allacma fusca TaxID=39272 RepID=A0A8J2LH42_9HEXA|nr:unnamed protein product [Allacma fusca]